MRPAKWLSSRSSVRRWCLRAWWTSLPPWAWQSPILAFLDDEFLAQLENLSEKILAVELLERLLEGRNQEPVRQQRGAGQEVL